MNDVVKQVPTSGVTPHLTISDCKANDAIAFYTSAFGATELGRMIADDGKRLMHAHIIVNGSSVMLNDDFPEYNGGPSAAPASVTLHLQVDDADAWWNRAIAAGATIRFPLDNQFWGDRYGQVTDPFGHVWGIGAPIRE